MGKPAARIGDSTAHGGAISVGFSTVLIGGKPAARLGDMHVCPMVTGVVPHIGGPVTMGSPTVIVGSMMAARVGDMLTCVGPPDTIAMGCTTVLIGESGGGGSSFTATGGATASSATAITDNNESITKEEHWVEIEFNDAAGLPISGIPYTFTDPDGNESEGVLRLDGTIRRDALSAGQCKAVLYNVTQAKWSKDEAKVGETVKLTAKVEGFEPGTEALIQIFKRDIKGPDVVVDEIRTQTQGEKVKAEWEYVYPEEVEEDSSVDSEQDGYSAPEYFFEVLVGRCEARSGLLKYQDWIEIKLVGEDGAPVAEAPYILYFSNGEVRKGKLDGSGKKREENVPPVRHKVRFPDNASRLLPEQ